MSEHTQPSEYIDIQAGALLLGTTKHKFHYHVDRGEIEIESGTERKSRRYRVSDILKVKERLKTKRRKPAPVLIDWMYAADVPVGLQLSMQVYPGEVDLREAAIYQAWRKNNNHITIAAYSPDRSACYATIQLVPLPESVIIDVLTGRREEHTIMADEVRPYTEPGPYTLLAVSVTALKSKPLLLYELLSRYIDFWIEMYPERYISKVYAQTVSESGIMLAQHLFMMPRYDLAFNAFELNLAYPSASKVIRQFKKRLAEKAPLPPDLQWPPVQPAENVIQSHQEAQEVPVASLPPSTPLAREKAISQPHTRTPDTLQPPGTITLQEFAAQLGIDRTSLREYIVKHGLPHVEIPNPARPKETKRYFTPEQQEAYRQYRKEQP